MRILVTGSTGFVGSHSARALWAAGHRVRLLVRDRAKAQRVLGESGLDLSDCVVGDATDPAAVGRVLEGCDGVLHAAALVALDARRAELVRRTNARAAELVLCGAHARGVSEIVYVSSASALFAPGGPPIAADAPLARAASAYGRSKVEGERIARRLRAEGAAIRISYPPAVVGPDDPGLSEGNRAIRNLVRQGVALTSSGFQLVDVRDLAALHAALIAKGAPPGGHVVAGPMLAWRELADRLDDLTGRRVRRFPLPGALLRALGRAADALQRIRPFDLPLSAETAEYATRWPGALCSPYLAALGVRLRPIEATLADTLRWLARAGHLAPAEIGGLA